MRLELLSYLYLYEKFNEILQSELFAGFWFSHLHQKNWLDPQPSIISYEILLSACFTPVEGRGELDPASPVAFPTSMGYWFIPAQIEMSAAESAWRTQLFRGGFQ